MLQKIQTLLYIIFLLIMIWQLAISQESTLGKQEAMFEFDGNTYVISNMGRTNTDPVDIKNVGSRISCDTLKEVTGQKVSLNHTVKDTKSFISGNNLSVQCIEPFSGVAVDYLSREFYEYTNKDVNKDVYEFYDRMALNEHKNEQLSQKGIKYIRIPWVVDHCTRGSDNKYMCDDSPSIKTRSDRVRSYLENILSEGF
jgi:hypothetical protein